MVYYSQQADIDLCDILIGLQQWGKHPLTYEHASEYVDDITDECDNLDNKHYHFPAEYPEHLEYGEYVFAYKRNPRTTWYVIYDIDNKENIYIQKIINNHLTIIAKY